MGLNARRERAEHTLVLDHDDCNHEPGDEFFCNPSIGAATCEAAVDAYCRYGCVDGAHGESGWALCEDECDPIRQEEADDNGWLLGGVLPHPGGDHCSWGHPLQSHDCWVLAWIENSDLQSLIAEDDWPAVGEVWRDGLVVIETWDADEFTVRYATADDVVPA